MDLPAETIAVILDALTDAQELREALYHQCPNRCDERGETCDECWQHYESATAYETLGDYLAEQADPPRGEQTIAVRGEVL